MSAIPLERADDDRGPGLRVMTSRRVAIILFNLGGPDGPDAVRPFLFNLFNDGAIIGLPQPFRFLLAQLISRSREKLAKANYAYMGGGSPLLPETQKQADALEAAMRQRISNVTFKCFPAMRYWCPLVKDAAKAAESWGATDVVLLPLYPQFSVTTTASSLKAWARASACPPRPSAAIPPARRWRKRTRMRSCAPGSKAARRKPARAFSAHSLPQRVIDRGDPYQWQVEQTAAAVKRLLPAEWETRISFQSRVGPIKWIGPSTEEEIRAAAKDRAGLLISPIAFVSEHVETLVELDIEYAALARQLGLPFYLRAPALGTSPRFIDALADLTAQAMEQPGKLCAERGARLCPASTGLCPQRSGG